MIREICGLHSMLKDDEKILIKTTRYDYETFIHKEDDLKIVGGNTLRITSPSRDTRVLNSNYIIVACITDKEFW